MELNWSIVSLIDIPSNRDADPIAHFDKTKAALDIGRQELVKRLPTNSTPSLSDPYVSSFPGLFPHLH